MAVTGGTSDLVRNLNKKRDMSSICDKVLEKWLVLGVLKQPGSMRNLRRWLRREVLKREGISISSNPRRVTKVATMLLITSGLFLSGTQRAEAAQAFTRTAFIHMASASSSTPTLVDIDKDGDLDLFSGEFQGAIYFLENTGQEGNLGYTLRTGTDNPLNDVDVGGSTAPTFADIDKDGDMDAFIGERYGTIKYFENTDGVFSPVFGVDNPLNGVATSGLAKPAFSDLDDDGDLDAFVGDLSGQIRYYENTEVGFQERTGDLNPFDGINVGSSSAPAFMDMDSDGDLDAIVGRDNGTYTVNYYENTGSAASPVFTELTGHLNPFNDISHTAATPAFGDLDNDGDQDLVLGWSYGNSFDYYENSPAVIPGGFFTEAYDEDNPLFGVDVGMYSTPTFADIDGDGDLDAFSGTTWGDVKYYKNTGSAETPVYVQQTGVDNPLNGFNVGGYGYSAPTFADIDSDGDLDIFVGEYYGIIHYWKNTGSASTPAFTNMVGAENPLSGVPSGNWVNSRPTFVDIDADGDLDAIIGSNFGTIDLYENTGSAINPTFVKQTGVNNPMDGFKSAPAFADLDRDGDLDLISGNGSTFNYYENTGSAANPTFVERSGADNPLDGFNVGHYGWAAPTFADFDGDGDLDVFAGEWHGTINLYRNDSSAAATPSFSEKTGVDNPLNGFNVGTDAAPTFLDIDADGDLDAFSGSRNGTIHHYENTGSVSAPTFVEQIGTDNPLDGFVFEDYTTPVFADIDGDGDLDAFVGDYDGKFNYYENTGNAEVAIFVEQIGVANPLDGFDVGGYGYSKPTFADIDGDGDLDIFAGEYDGAIKYFENTGSVTASAFVELTGVSNPLDSVVIYRAAPSFADLDFDGDLDAFVGGKYGTVKFYENTGSKEASTFVERSGVSNPLNGFDAGGYSNPTFADLDGDGDLDLMVGNSAGDFHYFEHNSAPRFKTPPAISGTAVVGEVLGLTGTETFDPEGDTVTLSYQWQADGFDIAGATSATYTLTVNEPAQLITCIITANDGNGGTTAIITAGVEVINSAPTFDSTPGISGTASVGEILSLTGTETTDVDGDYVTLSYQWQANSVDIAGATSDTYALTANESGKSVTATITAGDGNGGLASVTTSGVTVSAAANNAPTFDNTPAISGTPQVGSTLGLINTATTDVDGDTVTLSYQWQANGIDIAGATFATYTLTANESGQSVTAIITADDGNGGNTTINTAGVTVPESANAEADGGGGSISWMLLLAGLIVPLRRLVNREKG